MTDKSNAIRLVWGLVCPACLLADALDVTASTLVRLTEIGTDADASSDGSHEWGLESKAHCASCHWSGTVQEAENAHKQNPAKDRDRITFSRDELHAALGAWEHMLSEQEGPALAEHFETVGMAGMRICAIQAGRIALAVYNEMEMLGYELQISFDFDLIPAVLSKLEWALLVADNQGDGEPYKPDVSDLLDELMEANPQDFLKVHHELRSSKLAQKDGGISVSIHNRIQAAIDSVHHMGMVLDEADFSSAIQKSLDVIAQEIMAARPDLKPCSLDEWLANHWDTLTEHERSDIKSLLEAYQSA